MEVTVLVNAPTKLSGKPIYPVVLVLTKHNLHMDDSVAAAIGGRNKMMQILIPAMQVV